MAQKIVRADGKDVEQAKEEVKEEAKKQTVKKASEEGKKAKKAADQAVEEGGKKEQAVQPSSGKSTVGLRIGAAACWVVAFLIELALIFLLTDYMTLPISKTAALIIGIILDLGLCILGAQLWKKANRIKPMSGKNKFLFYLWAELGVIMAAICFLPLIILLLKDKTLSKKSKIIVTILAIVAMLIAGVASADFNPITAEEKAEAEQVITQDVFWSTFGHKYHLDQDCQAIRNSATLYTGTVTESIESGRTALCAFCAKNHPDLATEELKVEDGEAPAPADTTEAK